MHALVFQVGLEVNCLSKRECKLACFTFDGQYPARNVLWLLAFTR